MSDQCYRCEAEGAIEFAHDGWGPFCRGCWCDLGGADRDVFVPPEFAGESVGSVSHRLRARQLLGQP